MPNEKDKLFHNSKKLFIQSVNDTWGHKFYYLTFLSAKELTFEITATNLKEIEAKNF